ncbi:MAG: hypothetical protein SGJ18_08680 [Pseudomonadota bacterium]|nr:hypothetical protein [Pseudomonadota bacterium]
MKNLVVILVLLSGFNARASDVDNTKLIFCGSLEQIKQVYGNLTEADLAELTKSRQGMTSLLKNGKQAMKDLLDQGSKDDLGALPLIGNCAMIVKLKEVIRQGQCTDLDTNKPLTDDGAVAACELVMKSLQK